MTNITIPISDSYKNFTTRVAQSVIKSFIRDFNLPSNLNINYTGDGVVARIPNSSIDSSFEDVVSTEKESRIDVTVSDVPSEGMINSTSTSSNNQHPLFMDPVNEIIASPIYIKRLLTFEFTYRAQSRNEADTWLANLRSRQISGGESNQPILEYMTIIPEPIMLALAGLYDTIHSTAACCHDSFSEWLKERFERGVGAVASLDGRNVEWGFNSLQHFNIGKYEWGEEPTKAEGTAGGFDISFSYTIEVERPNEIQMSYPEIMANKLIPDNLFVMDVDPNYELAILDSETSLHGKSLLQLLQRGKKANGTVIDPPFDTWQCPNSLNGYYAAYQGAVLIDEQDATLCFQLTDLGDYKLNEYIQQYMSEQRECVVNLEHTTPFKVVVYRNDMLIDHRHVELDENLIVRLDFDMTIEDRWHVVVLVNARPHSMSHYRAKEFFEYGELAIRYLVGLNPLLLQMDGVLPTINSDGSISEVKYMKACKHIPTSDESFRSSKIKGPAYVGAYTVIGSRNA